MTRRPFLVDVVSLRRHPGFREHLVTHGVLQGMAITEAAVPDGAPVAVDLVLEAVEGGVVVKGNVTAPWVGECRRCLTAVAGEVVAEIEEIFVPDPEEGQTWPIEHNQLDLEPVVREAVVLELPLAPLCRPDCLGLCPTCGADLNAGPCACDGEGGDPRWAVLDVLRREPPG
ncbi:MAG TPA: DUF177 domain-containing protein [Acidimicrobiales bacterium]|nr:DUF177 domain-containing protein [Acidimicrobiales bacterium]